MRRFDDSLWILMSYDKNYQLGKRSNEPNEPMDQPIDISNKQHQILKSGYGYWFKPTRNAINARSTEMLSLFILYHLLLLIIHMNICLLITFWRHLTRFNV